MSLLSKLKGLGGSASRGSCVGLSIGSSSIKMVELAKSSKEWRLVNFGMVPLPDDALSNREIVNHLAVVENLKNLVEKAKPKSKNVCIAIAGASVIIKRMTVEVPVVKEMTETIFWEAEQYIPFDVSEVVMDFHQIGKIVDKKVDVLLVAVKRSVMESYCAAVTDAGLIPKIVDVEFFSMQNLFELNYPANAKDAVAVVDIGANSIKILITQNGVPLFTKDSTLGGRQLTQEIQNQLNLSFDDAEALKTGDPKRLPQEVLELMNVHSENYAQEIKRALDYYHASGTGGNVAFILLSGGSSKIPDLSRVVEEQIGLPTQIINPFNAVGYDPNALNPQFIQSIAPTATIATGLALRAGAGTA